MKQLFKDALPIIKKLEDHGYPTYFVGGSVRDLLLNREIGDIDIATAASPSVVQSLFKKVLPVGIEHGTVIVVNNSHSYEVTTFRVEGSYSDFRHPDSVKFVSKIEDDLSRRDFTINAMAMDSNGMIIDPYDGQKDLTGKNIRTVGVPFERFQEDPLRIMRALRFSSQLGFTISHDTWHALVKSKHWLKEIAVERLAIEFEKLCKGKFFEVGFNHLVDSQIGDYLPVFKQYNKLTERLNDVVDYRITTMAEMIVLSVILEPNLKIADWVSSWKLSKDTLKKSQTLFQAFKLYQSNGLTNHCLYTLSEDLLEPFSNLLMNYTNSDGLYDVIQNKYRSLPIKDRKDLAITGHDLIRLNPDEKPGPWLNECLIQVEKKVLQEEIVNDKGVIKEWLLRWKRQENN